MANGNIRGITIEIGGDTTGLENALKDVNKQSKDLQTELKEVERGLKLDPGNVELVRQKQQLLTQSIEATSDKLHVLRQAQGQVEAQFRRGEIGEEQYRAFRRELVNTENNMRSLQGQLNSMQSEQQRLSETTRSLGAFFDATGTDVEQFAGTLGTRLTQAIRNGTASADQMERALRLMGRQALGASTDIDEMRRVLNQINNGSSINVIRNELQQMNTVVVTTQSELKEIDKLLKFNPNNVELLTQKQALLTRSIQDTSTELQQLQQRQSQVEAQFRSGQIGEEQYRAFRREIEETEQSLVGYQNQLNTMQQEQQQVQTSTRHLQTLFDATGTSVDQFADAIGNDLVRAIQAGRASSTQIEQAIRQIGQHAVGAEVDIDQLREALRNVDNGANLDEIRADIDRIRQSANEAEQSVEGLGNQLGTVIGGLAAGGGIAGAVQQAFDVSSLDTKIDISFNVPEESKESVREAIKSIEAYGVDGEEALEGVRRQWALNKDASDELNSTIVKGAAVIAKSYQGVDFIELVQEVNEIGASLQISNEEALALTNALLKVGFPPEQLDTIAEYGLQMKQIGFSTAEIQAIFEKGVDLKSWNIDNLNDGVKEANLQMRTFGEEVPKSLSDLLAKTDLSTKQMQTWGKSVAAGGKEGALAMGEVSDWLQTIEDDSLRNALAVAVFGTKAEDQGDNMIKIFQGVADAQDKTVQNQQTLQEMINSINADALVNVREAFIKIVDALRPVLTAIADVISKIAEWVSSNAGLGAAIVAIVATIGILTGAFAVLMPAIAGLISAWPVLAGAIASIGAPILIAVGAIAGLGAAFVALWKNSETFRNNLSTVFEAIKNVTVTVFEAVASFIGEKIAQIKSFWDTEGAQILQAAENIFNGIKAVIDAVMPAIKLIIDAVWTAIKQVITGALDVIMGAVKVFSGLFTGDFSKMWEGIKGIFSGAINLIIGWVSLTFFGGIKTLLANLGKTGLSLMKGMWDNILGVFKSVGGSIKNLTNNTLTAVVNFFKNFVTNVKTQMSNAKQKIVDTWNEAVTFLKNINLVQIGKDIINGLIKGIGSMASSVVEKVKEIASGIPDMAKKVLGIHSPSRVMMGVGEDTVDGLVVGMDNNSAKVKKAVSTVGNLMIDETKKYSASVKDLNKKEADELAKIEQDKAYKINQIVSKAKANKKKLTAAQNAQIDKIEDDAAAKAVATQQKYADQLAKINADLNKAKLESVKTFIQDKKSLDELSLIDEALLWQRSLDQFGAKSKERIEAQKAYQSAVQAINKEITAINTDYSNQVNKINDDLIKQEETLTKAYADAVDKRAQSLVSFKNLFDAFKVEIDVTGEELLVNLGTQVEGFKVWQREIEKLSERAIDKGLLEELRQMGPNALPQLIALNRLTDQQLQQYSNLYREKSALARKQAEAELVGMKNDTDKQIRSLRDTADRQLVHLQRDWNARIGELTQATATQLSTLQQIGRDAGQGLLNGLSSMQGPLIARAQEIANQISNAIKSALQVKSPSRVMMEIGTFVGEGLIVGMDDMIGKVAQSSARLAGAVTNAQSSLSSSAQKSIALGSSKVMSSTSTVDNSKYMQPNITIINQVPNASPSEIARKALQSQRQLAMEWGVV